jgi:hypothetical protein
VFCESGWPPRAGARSGPLPHTPSRHLDMEIIRTSRAGLVMTLLVGYRCQNYQNGSSCSHAVVSFKSSNSPLEHPSSWAPPGHGMTIYDGPSWAQDPASVESARLKFIYIDKQGGRAEMGSNPCLV